MGYMMRVRLSSFLAGAAVTSAAGFLFLYRDYRIALEAISRRVTNIQESLDSRISALENWKEPKTSAIQLEVEAAE